MEWRGSLYARDPKKGSLPGDLLYWYARGPNRWGHVAIRVPGNGIVENSTLHWPRNHGKGYRKLSQLARPPDLVVRLPAARLELTPQGLRRLWQISPALPES